MSDRCTRVLWDSLPAPRCTRERNHPGGHVYIGDTAPDRHDDIDDREENAG